VPNGAAPAEDRDAYVGWMAGGLVLLAVFVGAAVLWFIFHP